MKYEDALNYINDKEKFGSRLGLETIGRLLELLGSPHKKLKHIHVAGTNGKGSTSSYLSNILKEAGYKVGLFTSPYIERFNERIQINNEDIRDEALGSITGEIKEKISIMLEEGYDHPTTFEIITAIAFEYFYQEGVDYVVLEVGLGGRHDSTNIIDKSLLSVITTIDIDHVDILGSSLREIAWQKAGIIKEGGLVVSYPQKDEARQVLEEEARLKGAEIIFLDLGGLKINSLTDQGARFDISYENQEFKDVKISMLGEYQVYNSSLALASILELRKRDLVSISNEEIRRGLVSSQWPARLELVRRRPNFLIDGAHNLQGAIQLKKALGLFTYKKLILGLGILGDKDYDHMVEELAPLADLVIVTEVNMPRKLDGDILARKVREYKDNVIVEKDIKKAIEKAIEVSEDYDLIVFAGSLYLVGEVKGKLKLL